MNDAQRVEQLRQLIRREEADLVDAKATEQRRRRSRQRIELQLQAHRRELQAAVGGPA